MEHEILLTNLEKRTLSAMGEIGTTMDVPEIVSKSQLSESEINRAVEWLKEKKLISVEDVTMEIFKSQELAKEYAINDFPEQKFLKSLLNSPLAINEIASKAGLDKNEFNASLGLLKNSGAIDISSGKATLTKEGSKMIKMLDAQKELIKLLEEPKYVEEIPHEYSVFFPSLEKRGLIKRNVEKIKRVTLEAHAKKLIPHLVIKDEIDQLTQSMILDGSWKDKDFRRYALDVPAQKPLSGKRQFYSKYLKDAKDVLIGLGFEEMERGPMVEFSLFNCDMLYMPQDHPAREIQDAFFIKGVNGDISKCMELAEKVKAVHETGKGTKSTGWGYKFNMEKTAELLLRSQTTAVSSRLMSSGKMKDPGKYFIIDRNYRVDSVDWKHLIEFEQLEGVVTDGSVTFRDLLGILRRAAKEFAGTDKVRYVPVYYPFTEPSVGILGFLEGKGWVALGGAGMFRPEVLEPLGIKHEVIAWGLGIGRMCMTKHNIQDIRDLFASDLKLLRETKWK